MVANIICSKTAVSHVPHWYLSTMQQAVPEPVLLTNQAAPTLACLGSAEKAPYNGQSEDGSQKKLKVKTWTTF